MKNKSSENENLCGTAESVRGCFTEKVDYELE